MDDDLHVDPINEGSRQEHTSQGSESDEIVSPACPNGANCLDLMCQFCDPFQPRPCESGATCWNPECIFQHPSSWRVCEKGVCCFEFGCKLIHPKGRLLECSKGAKCVNSDCENLHPDDWIPASHEAEIDPRMMEKRRVNREKAALPMLSSKDDFLSRLQEEKVLVVTAETGSGKTTQLPQYCAETFSGIIVCTQPRVIAAISVARRIAAEFDDASVGRNVGYEVGGGRKVQGHRIMIVTDAALIRMAQNDPLLKQVGVLMIDEAHERSLNTDIVVGIAKIIIRQRPDNFKVVIASATIDPKPFLDFFFDAPDLQAIPRPLKVLGRVFPVTTETRAVGSNIDDINTILAEEVTKTLKERSAGHCLVFLHGAREVERAIVNFKKSAQPNWIPLPLYGALAPEEQNRVLTFDDQRGTLRMVVFCTNVAETSLTVPNVRVVIDTGLAKEARFDADRRMTILDEVYISQSSAEQRKGRAGRTAEGHCVRLFEWEKLTRKNIEPEILRSSLDLVMLQVCSLGFNPLEFSFITRPDETLMRSSLAMLRTMDCLTETFRLTNRGRLFNSLPFDPRLSHFVLLAHEVYNNGDAAAEIAAILSAPGSILFFGDSNKGRNQKARQDASGFTSDLLMLRTIYNTWLEAGGLEDGGRCSSCHKKLPKHIVKNDNGCRTCRTKHSNSNSLNNKVLDIVRGTVSQVQKVIGKQTAHSSTEVSTIPVKNIEEAIGVCLAQSFPEQVCEFVMPSDPTLGIYSIASDLKGQLSFSSVLRAPRIDSKFIIPMSLTKLPSGLLLMNQAHHVALEWMPVEFQQKVKDLTLNMIECYKKKDISARYSSHCRKFFKDCLSDAQQLVRFAVCLYDTPSTMLTVYGPGSCSKELKQLCEDQVGALLKEDLGHELVVDGFSGFATVTVTAGFNIKKIDAAQQSCRMHFINPPVKSDKDLLQWICKIASCTAADIKWHKYQPSYAISGQSNMTKVGIVIFRLEELAQRAQRNYVSSKGGAVASFEGNCRTSVKYDGNNLQELLHSRGVTAVNIRNLRPATYQIQLLSVPESISEARLRALLRRHSIPNPKLIRSTKPVNGTYKCFITFNEHSTQIGLSFQAIPELNSSFQITIPFKGGCGGTREITVTTRSESKILPAEYFVIFRECEEADKLFRLQRIESSLEVDGNAVVIAQHPEYFLLEEHSHEIASKNDVKFKLGRELNKGREILFFRGMPSKCNKAAQQLRNILDPIKYFFGTRDKRLMGAELRDSGKLQKWAEEFSVCVEENIRQDNSNFVGIVVYGEGYNRGRYMARLADYYTDFVARYHLLNLSPSACCLFRKGCPGDVALAKLTAQKTSDEVQISYQYFLSSIEIVVNPNPPRPRSVIIKECTEAVNDILHAFQQTTATIRKCVYCKTRPGSPFMICGHPYCKECLQQVIEMQVSSLPIIKNLKSKEAVELENKLRSLVECCPTCKTPISIRDVTSSLNRSSQEKVCTAFAKLLLLREVDHPFAMCPEPVCDGLVLKQKGYSLCHACCKYVCPLCGIIDDERHANRTCPEYQKSTLLKSVSIQRLVRSAEDFARSNWPNTCSQLGQIVEIKVNPGLENGCMALQRYCKGIKHLRLQDLEASSIFAWHGTPRSAIPAICNDGFDPKRRSRQVRGTGEYFGVSPDISLGYANGCNCLLVSQLINCSSITKHVPNFCYVVNNPTDWNYAFNLPVLVIAFGSSIASPIDWIMEEKRPLPPPFDEPLTAATEESSSRSIFQTDLNGLNVSRSTTTVSRPPYANQGIPSHVHTNSRPTYVSQGIPSHVHTNSRPTYVSQGIPSHVNTNYRPTYASQGIPSQYASQGMSTQNKKNSSCTIL